MPTSKRTAAIIVAAGRGLRAGSGGPKQYRSIGGRTVIARAMEPFCLHPQVSAVQPVVNPDDMAMFNEAASELRYQPPANGGSHASGFGACRAGSARRGSARYRSDPRRRTAVRFRSADFARDRSCRQNRSGGAGDSRNRHHQAHRRLGKCRSNAGARAAAHRADAAGISLRCDFRCASPRRARTP